MKKYLPFGLLALCCSLLMAKCSCEHLCTNAIPEINFVNFDSTELHAVIVGEYNNNGKFDGLVNTKVYSTSLMPGPDTFSFSDNKIIVGGFNDYMVTVPAINKTWRIRGINIHHDGTKTKEQCTGGMTYYVDDTIHYVPINTMAANQPGLINITK